MKSGKKVEIKILSESEYWELLKEKLVIGI